MNTPENITSLDPIEFFVFGSNLRGRHGAGAAKVAWLKFYAQEGAGEGLTGQCYAIPTKDLGLTTLPLENIQAKVKRFLDFAWNHPESRFLVTKIGCGLAGYQPKQIAPFFRDAPGNVILPKEFTLPL